ncbi:hypothetical protein GCM10009069_07040 [Algimonas arctica]|uniref:Uncharacterized protein n=1 Tax=Algimonas arctica TaxID=1479486 RepID=A0A8J3G1A0_9PROT|nr:hypothetical protein GCM10009069_07040 [Algimonas arctica]
MLMVPGSGPTDCDGNNPMGVRAASYRLLAEGLGDAGSSTLRIDKRGMFGSAGAGGPYLMSCANSFALTPLMPLYWLLIMASWSCSPASTMS